ncbi:phosphoserine transaminase [Aquihabitans sp. G128]|uniref:phosphoserine transaminase n=1 Tax=Aquihabitans sp. G128 TaxID=2849779 RepID=UPI001C227534|nr:phosphoserine transaminase [Aquihabitans sp. G128]QXC63087.1 phosphoserine transaminase [Aquihabitans sp. G128]
MSTGTPSITIPADLLPVDGRFGCGPSKVRPEAVAALAAEAPDYLGTSHRQAPVKFMVSRLRNAVAELFALPDGYEVILGNGGTTAFWDAAVFGLIDDKSQHLTFGEFSGKFAECATRAPFLQDPSVISAEPGTAPTARAEAGIDLYALTHNETSTGVAIPIVRPEGADDGALVAVDATSAAGGLKFDASQTDVYYFAPQKCLASDGGLWIAAVSPTAVERIERVASSGRWIPASLDLKIALDNSLKDQTYNTPALATIFLAVHQMEWINQNGGLGFSSGRSARSAEIVYGWAERSDYATPYVADPALRSNVVATIDLDDAIDATTVSKVLRANGVVDTESYRKLGRNQLRVALFPAIDAEDVDQLTRCIDHVVAELRTA